VDLIGRGERLRATLALSSLLVAMGGLSGRLYDLQVRQHERYSALARKQHQRVRPLIPWRGELLAQEDGRTVPIATSLARGSLLVEGKGDRDDDLFLERLQHAIDIPPAERAALVERLAHGKPFFFRRRHLLPDEMDRIQALSLDGASVIEEPVRAYPYSGLAIQTLGLLSADGEGVSGLERAFEEQLRGVRGLREVELDNRHHELLELTSVEVEARPGLSLELTIDRRIQAIVEEELDGIVERWQPQGAACVVVEPQTGRILAIATRPTFSPENTSSAPAAAFRNLALMESYEPGSTIKPLVVGTAWDEGVGAPTEPISCPRMWWLPGRKKAIEDHATVGDVTEADVLVQSSNVGAVQIGARLGMPRIRRALEGFGFGKSTGIGLGESTGNVRALAKTDATTLGTVCQGYGVTATPLQMALAYASIANGGTLFRPRLVDALVSASGDVVRRFEPVPVTRTLSTHAAKDLLAPAMERVVSDKSGTAHACKVPGYTLAGKTGTTKRLEGGHYSESQCDTSFCGFAPHDDPRIAFSVVVFKPSTAKGKVWGGTVAAPAASAIVGKTLKYLGVPENARADESAPR
jgi:cell division protein FtsI/penicillin-binding protein 2